ncbi:MAG TPA: hypothetical protein VM925_31195 [Labilithrix sp.]|nr:hypothetical protein [Labilithrix sp.]
MSSSEPLRGAPVRSARAVIGAVIVALVACSEAGGDVKGGGLTDSGLEATSPPPPAEAPCVGSGTKWSDLYRDIFGPTGRPGSCSFRSNCHGTPDGAGARSGAGIECFDEKACRQSLFDKNIVSPSDSAAPDSSGLFVGLLRIRRPDGTVSGFMPQAPADYIFPSACLERMKTWIRDGAKDD